MFILNIIVIECLNKIWNSFQISFHFSQEFLVNTFWEQMK